MRFLVTYNDGSTLLVHAPDSHEASAHAARADEQLEWDRDDENKRRKTEGRGQLPKYTRRVVVSTEEKPKR